LVPEKQTVDQQQQAAMRTFSIFTVGWEPPAVGYLLAPIAERTGIQFIHGVLGDARRIEVLSKRFPDRKWMALSKSALEPMPSPDFNLLGSLESVGIPTVRTMVRGDPVLRRRDPNEALAYATLVARRIDRALLETRPDVVLASFDSLHSALSLAVAKSRGIPWVALAFTVIPEHLTGFCRGVTPEQLVPIGRRVDESLRAQARDVLARFRARNVRVMAYRPPESVGQKARQFGSYSRNLLRRFGSRGELGIDRFIFPTAGERLADIVRRTINQLRLPSSRMLQAPPEGQFVFFPLHMAPESTVDTWAPMHQNQLELAAQMSLALPTNVELVVKLHFSDPDNYSRRQLLQLMQLPRVRIAHPKASSRAFIEQASIVAGITGTACLEGALLGKPVLLFGDSPYQHFPRSERASRPEALHGQIRRMLELPSPDDEQIIDAFAAFMARYLPGRLNDWSIPLQTDDLDRLAACFQALRSHVETPGTREAWYGQSPYTGVAESTEASPAWLLRQTTWKRAHDA
jgi:hypothetical protein